LIRFPDSTQRGGKLAITASTEEPQAIAMIDGAGKGADIKARVAGARHNRHGIGWRRAVRFDVHGCQASAPVRFMAHHSRTQVV
jgi:hypothetical protein